MNDQTKQKKDRHLDKEDVVLLRDCTIGEDDFKKDEKITVRGDQADWMRARKIIA